MFYSPTKTLQQILAERQKALNDANQLQQARAASASGTVFFFFNITPLKLKSNQFFII